MKRRGDRGVALLTALAVLVVLSMLGAAYVRYLSIDMQASRLEEARLRAREGAEAGLRAATARIRSALEAEQTLRLPQENELELPIYRLLQTALVADDDQVVRVRVRISDESARISINTAPAAVLAAVDGIGEENARRIVQARPKDNSAPWFVDASQLMPRGLLSEEAFERARPFITAQSVLDPREPQPHLNINAVPESVLAPLLDLPANAAQTLSDQRPFDSLNRLAAAAGRGVVTFDGDGRGAEMLPEGLAAGPCVFRIVSEAATLEDGDPRARARIEATAQWNPSAGRLEFVHWSEERTPVPEQQDAVI
jgi:type II secretory pathway component PulK